MESIKIHIPDDVMDYILETAKLPENADILKLASPWVVLLT